MSSISKDVKVLIVPHNFGIPYNDIKLIKERFPELLIIEDVAHSFGSHDKDGELCGTIGDASFFSLEYSKPITSGLGGIMIINNPKILNDFNDEYLTLAVMRGSLVRKLIISLGVYNLCYSKRTTFFQTNALRVIRRLNLLYKTSDKEIQGELPNDYPVRLSPRLACFLPPQLKKIKKINSIKRTIVKSYDEFFSKLNDFETFHNCDDVLVRYPILFKRYVTIETIMNIKKEGFAKGYIFGEWFNDVVHPKGSFRYGYTNGECENGEYVADRILNLPVNINYVLENNDFVEIKAIFNNNGIN